MFFYRILLIAEGRQDNTDGCLCLTLYGSWGEPPTCLVRCVDPPVPPQILGVLLGNSPFVSLGVGQGL